MPWVLTLLITCAPALAAAGQPPRPAAVQGSAKDGNHKKAQVASANLNERERWKWWLYDRAELGITDQQSLAINDIFESNIARLRDSRKDLDRAEDELSRTIKEHKADLAVVSAQLDRVETARSHHNKTRVLMLYRMHLLLSADQRARLEALRARQDASRKDHEPSSGRRRYP